MRSSSGRALTTVRWHRLTPSNTFLGRSCIGAVSPNTVIFFDGACGFCRRAVLALRDVMFLSATELREAQSDPNIEAMMRARNSWIVRDSEGELHSGYDAFVALSRHSILTWWLAPALGWRPVRWVGERMYRWVASHRSALSRLLGTHSRNHSEP